ncbi:MAG TPA: helix-turn-helix transcriptional regulator [Ottowia sp.]|jgi:hypothetical protein|nr:helix-turn-helix transcriptional regulator [Ottowia sp.]
MNNPTAPGTMNPQQLTAALSAIGWRQVDFARRVGVTPAAVSTWTTGKAPAPLWVGAYLGAMLDLAALHSKYLAPLPAPGADEAGGAESPAPARLAHVLASKSTAAP